MFPNLVDLAQCIRDWRTESLITHDALNARHAAQLAATLDIDSTLQRGDALPPLWHWVYFTEWPCTADLGVDGHPRDGQFLPPIPERRRMFAGGRLTVHSPLLLEEPATRQAEVTSTAVKAGKTGELLFVTVRYEFTQGGRACLTEEQDLVYRSGPGSSAPLQRVTEPLAAKHTPWSIEPATHPALLFRFSALTANAHRIHYDEQYTTQVEGFPGLVVHGPLLAVFMAELVRANAGSALRRLEFRLQRPVFVGDRFRVQGELTGSRTAEMAVVTGAGQTHATARVELT